MTSTELIALIKECVDEDININPQSFLIGGESSIDSMNLVQICIALEEKADSEGFRFDWTSEKAMSSMTSIFRTPEALADEYNKQKAAF